MVRLAGRCRRQLCTAPSVNPSWYAQTLYQYACCHGTTFHYGLNLMRPPAARRCLHTNGFRQAPKPPPTLPPVHPSSYPSRLRLAIFLYIRFPRFSVVLLLSDGPLSVAYSRYCDSSARVARCAIQVVVSYCVK